MGNLYLLDIIIAIIAFVVIVSSFFKPTFRYVRWLVGFLFAGVTVILVKSVKVFNFVENALINFLDKIKFANFAEIVIEFFKGDIADSSKLNQASHIMALAILGLLVFILVNVIMGLSHGAKVRRENKKGNYVYNKPFASFILSLFCVVFGVVAVTITFKALPFSVNYVSTENSYIMYYTYNGLNFVFDSLKSVIPSMRSLDDYIKVITYVKGA